MARVFESFYLVTVPHGRQGTIPYQYPPAANNPEANGKLPKAKDIISFCFPDLDEIRKNRALDFKAPPVSQASGIAGLPLSVAGLPLGVGGVGGTQGTATSPVPGPQGGNAAVSKPNFRPEFYSFTIKDQDGSRLLGVVYRCLPAGYGLRYDVGKRFPECLCIITRHCHTQAMFQQVLQLIHSMKLMFAPIDKIEWLLNGIYSRPIPSPGENISLKYSVHKGLSRMYNFIWPGDGDVPVTDPLASLYLFQQLKPKAFVTLLTAILCERRICFIATDIDKLASCVQAAVGLVYPFSWQHIIIPVLASSLSSYACVTSPIIFGIRRQQLPILSELPLEDLIYVDLDAGELSYGQEATPVPDIYVLPNTSQMVQAAQKLGAEAAKAAEKLDKAFTKGVALLQKYTGQQLAKDSEEPKPDAANVLAWDLSLLNTSRSSNPIMWNAKAKLLRHDRQVINDEQQLRDHLLAFFVNIVGDASTYLRPDRSGRLLLDTDFYLGSRGMLGDGPALSMFLDNLVQSSLFVRLAEARKAQVTADREGRTLSPRSLELSGPFMRTVEALKQRAEPFTISNIKKALKSTQQVTGEGAEAATTSGRWSSFHEGALQLTSSYATSDAQHALSALILDSYSSMLLPSIMRVLWNRLGDCKGLRWKHAYKGVTLLRELLIRGPESVLSEALANVALLRTFLEYKAGMGMGQGNKVREVSQEVFFLILDVRKYMLIRSVAWAGKKKLAQPKMRLSIDHCLSSSFEDMHGVVAPHEHHGPAPPMLASDISGDEATAVDNGEEVIEDVSVFTTDLAEGEEGAGPEVTSIARMASDSSGGMPAGPTLLQSESSTGSSRWEQFGSEPGVKPQLPAEQSSWVSFGSNGGTSGSTGSPQGGWESFPAPPGSAGRSGPPAKPGRRRSGTGTGADGLATDVRGMAIAEVPPSFGYLSPSVQPLVPPGPMPPPLFPLQPLPTSPSVQPLLPTPLLLQTMTPPQGPTQAISPPLIQLSNTPPPPPPMQLPPPNLPPIEPQRALGTPSGAQLAEAFLAPSPTMGMAMQQAPYGYAPQPSPYGAQYGAVPMGYMMQQQQQQQQQQQPAVAMPGAYPTYQAQPYGTAQAPRPPYSYGAAPYSAGRDPFDAFADIEKDKR